MRLVACPFCGTTKTRLAARRSFTDRLFGYVTIYPFRCQLCARRFRSFLGRVASNPRRNFDRVAVDFPVWLKPLHALPHQLGEEGIIQDLSIRGCRIRCERPVVPGTRVVLEFQHSSVSFPITVEEAIVRFSSQGELGLRFIQLHRQDQRRIRSILDLWLPEPALPR
ncbi:MAG: PilZ domain-containing protein [Nitrospira sp.]|nr:PilZ domain-containing protein [Nitrospira sp.]